MLVGELWCYQNILNNLPQTLILSLQPDVVDLLFYFNRSNSECLDY